MKIARSALLAALCLTIPTVSAAKDLLPLTVAQVVRQTDANTGAPVLMITLDADSAMKLNVWSWRHVGAVTELKLGDAVILTPTLREPIQSGVFNLSAASFKTSDLEELVAKFSQAGVAFSIDVKD